MIDIQHVMKTFRIAAMQAGDVIMDIYNSGDFGLEVKPDDSPVTRADKAADAVISRRISAGLPDIALVTEEQADTHDLVSDTFILVDPLDGTKEFLHKRGDFTVNLALIRGGVPVLGLVYAPARGRLFYTIDQDVSVEEKGPFSIEHIGDLVAMATRKPDNAALDVVASKSHRDQATDDYISKYRVNDAKSAGSSLKFCLVASGEADLYPRLGPTMEWDTAAGDAVLRGAGGGVVDFDQKLAFTYGKPGFRNGPFIAYGAGVDLK
jgi:3'(2'), 5'-bisphosphate nucleotidase